MKSAYSDRRPWVLFAVALLAVLAVAGVHAATTGKVIIIQSNSAGDRVTLWVRSQVSRWATAWRPPPTARAST